MSACHWGRVCCVPPWPGVKQRLYRCGGGGPTDGPDAGSECSSVSSMLSGCMAWGVAVAVGGRR